jgi:hypothetical protein
MCDVCVCVCVCVVRLYTTRVISSLRLEFGCSPSLFPTQIKTLRYAPTLPQAVAFILVSSLL